MDLFVLGASVVMLVAIYSVRLSSRLALPSLLLYLLMGVALGEDGVGIHFDNAEAAHALGFAALALILAEGGLTTNWRELRKTIRVGSWMATGGVVISVAVMTLAMHYVLGFGWHASMLIGAITSPTDAAAVFSVLRVVRVPRRIRAALEAESGLNDAPTVVLVALISEGGISHHSWYGVVGIIVAELLGGLAIGWIVGIAGSAAIKRIALPSVSLYPLALLTVAALSYSGAAVLHASGFAAIYVTSLVLGNTSVPNHEEAQDFAESIAWVAQIGLFVMLGLLLSPNTLTWRIVGEALLGGLFLTFLARPMAVLSGSLVKRMNWRDMTFLSWAGLRGAVPIVLATIPLAADFPDALRIFDIVFVMTVIYTILTAPTLPFVARKLDLITPVARSAMAPD